MFKRKLYLFLAACLFLTTACSLLPAAANILGPTPPETTLQVDKNVNQPTALASETAVATARPKKTASPAATAAGRDPLKILKQVPDKLDGLKSYRVNGQVTGGSDSMQDGNLLMEVISPDRLHLSLPSFEFYSIGTTAYYKFGAGAAWMKGAQLVAGRNPLGVAVIDPRQLIADAVKANGVNLGKPADLNGMPMLVYNFTATASDPNSSSGTLWVGPDDGLPYKLLDVEQDGTNVELNYYDFNADFKINPPIP
jgi:hypothetical protein